MTMRGGLDQDYDSPSRCGILGCRLYKRYSRKPLPLDSPEVNSDWKMISCLLVQQNGEGLAGTAGYDAGNNSNPKELL